MVEVTVDHQVMVVVEDILIGKMSHQHLVATVVDIRMKKTIFQQVEIHGIGMKGELERAIK